MISEWFNDALARYGHRRADSFPRLSNCFITIDQAIEMLSRYQFHHVIRLRMSENAMKSACDLKEYIEEYELTFGPWTSFRSVGDLTPEIVYAFRFVDDAVRVRLILEA